MTIIYCDGGSRGNPGPAASAFVVTEDEKVIYKGSRFLGKETNNVAEYTAVLIALDWLISENFTKDVVFNLDSQLIERQINGLYKVKNDKLKTLYTEVQTKIKTIPAKIKFLWNYRTGNTLADALVNEELDKHKTS